MNISMGQAVEPLEEDTARNFFRQMILAIEYLHENGIVNCVPICFTGALSTKDFVLWVDTPRHQTRKYLEDVRWSVYQACRLRSVGNVLA